VSEAVGIRYSGRVTRAWGLVLASVLAVGPSALAGDEPPGVLAWSAGDRVGLADPLGRWAEAFETGPVGWLYPAPGGVLFAPDLIDGRTSVLDLRKVAVADRFDGVMVPWFGDLEQRYYVCLPGELLIVSYPDRATIAKIETDVRSPWRFVVAVDDSSALVLDRSPDGSGEVAMAAVDLVSRRQVYRRPLHSDVRHIALSSVLGVLAVADAGASSVALLEPATLSTVSALPVTGAVRDVGFAHDDTTLVAAMGDEARADVCAWQLKAGADGLRARRQRCAPLTGSPLRLAVSPDGERVAVATGDGWTSVFGVRRLDVEARIETPPAIRDLVWVDPSRSGPPVPEWSDDRPPELSIGRLPPPADR